MEPVTETPKQLSVGSVFYSGLVMVKIGPSSSSRQVQICFVLFASFALAALKNVTVDDTIVTAPYAPAYLPNASSWNQGNNCPGCFVQPDASHAYDGTWHDTTFSPNSTLEQSFEFTFEGSGLYIFFILANTVQYATTFTSVNFVLDGNLVSSFSHVPSSSTDYLYNQTVYANDSIPYGQHTMRVVPVNTTESNVLILFDYLIYTTETTSTVSTTVTSTAMLSPSTSTVNSSSGQNIGAIVGGTVGGIVALIAVIISLSCYRRHRRRMFEYPSKEMDMIEDSPAPEMTIVDPFINSDHISPTSNEETSLLGPSNSEVGSGKVSLQSSNLASTVAGSLSVASSDDNTGLRQEVGLLRGEVARLRRFQDQILDDGPRSEPPPEYS